MGCWNKHAGGQKNYTELYETYKFFDVSKPLIKLLLIFHLPSLFYTYFEILTQMQAFIETLQMYLCAYK